MITLIQTIILFLSVIGFCSSIAYFYKKYKKFSYRRNLKKYIKKNEYNTYIHTGNLISCAHIVFNNFDNNDNLKTMPAAEGLGVHIKNMKHILIFLDDLADEKARLLSKYKLGFDN